MLLSCLAVGWISLNSALALAEILGWTVGSQDSEAVLPSDESREFRKLGLVKALDSSSRTLLEVIGTWSDPLSRFVAMRLERMSLCKDAR